MDTIVYMLAGILIAIVIFAIYLLMIRYESKKIYTMRDLKPQRVDEKGKELCYCIGFNFWHYQKQQLIKQYYGMNSIIEDNRWEIDYKIIDIRGPYRKIPGCFFEQELEFKVISVKAKDEIIIDEIAVKIYEEDSYRFNVEKYCAELEEICLILGQNVCLADSELDLIESLCLMRDTNLMKRKELVKICEYIEKSIPVEKRENMKIYAFLKEILNQSEQYRQYGTNINLQGGQLNIAQGNGELNAIQNIYMNVEQKSNFAKRLDVLIEIMNRSRELYEETITVGYICQLMGEKSENIIRQYYSTLQEPTIDFMESLAEKLGVSKRWLAKGANVAIFDTDEIRSGLSDILRNVTEAEKIYIVIGNECYGNYLRIILKYNDIKYKCYKKSFIFHVSAGAAGQTQLMEVYDFLQKVKAMRNKNGQEIYPSSAYFLSEEQWNNLMQGNMYPAAIRKVKDYKAHIMDDFLDVGNLYRSKEQYRLWYGEEFIKCQEYIRERLLIEERDYI